MKENKRSKKKETIMCSLLKCVYTKEKSNFTMAEKMFEIHRLIMLGKRFADLLAHALVKSQIIDIIFGSWRFFRSWFTLLTFSFLLSLFFFSLTRVHLSVEPSGYLFCSVHNFPFQNILFLAFFKYECVRFREFISLHSRYLWCSFFSLDCSFTVAIKNFGFVLMSTIH